MAVVHVSPTEDPGTGIVQITTTVWRPFEAEFRDFRNEIEKKIEDVREEIHLAECKAAHQERLLQEMERKEASQQRRISSLIHRKAQLESDEAHSWRIQTNERRLSRHLSNEDWLLWLMALKKSEDNNYSQSSLPMITRGPSSRLVKKAMELPASGPDSEMVLKNG